MNRGKREISQGGRLSGTAIVCASIISAASGAALLASNRTDANKLRLYSFAATEAPPTGALRGWDGINDSEWSPVESGRSGGSVVLFSIAAPGGIGDLEFWRDISRLVRTATTDVQLVGLCSTDAACDQSMDAGGTLTLLTAMDPLQVHAVSTQARLGRALVMHKSRVVAALQITPDRQSIASEIVDIARHFTTGSGA